MVRGNELLISKRNGSRSNAVILFYVLLLSDSPTGVGQEWVTVHDAGLRPNATGLIHRDHPVAPTDVKHSVAPTDVEHSERRPLVLRK